jgi:hypothetical protein
VGQGVAIDLKGGGDGGSGMAGNEEARGAEMVWGEVQSRRHGEVGSLCAGARECGAVWARVAGGAASI